MSKIMITETKKLTLPKGSIPDAVMEEFKKNLKKYITSLNTAIQNGENEEHIKNIINKTDFRIFNNADTFQSYFHSITHSSNN